MANYNPLEIIATEALEEITAGKSSSCKWAILTCTHDTLLAGFGTSDPASSCAFMRQVCK